MTDRLQAHAGVGNAQRAAAVAPSPRCRCGRPPRWDQFRAARHSPPASAMSSADIASPSRPGPLSIRTEAIGHPHVHHFQICTHQVQLLAERCSADRAGAVLRRADRRSGFATRGMPAAHRLHQRLHIGERIEEKCGSTCACNSRRRASSALRSSSLVPARKPSPDRARTHHAAETSLPLLSRARTIRRRRSASRSRSVTAVRPLPTAVAAGCQPVARYAPNGTTTTITATCQDPSRKPAGQAGGPSLNSPKASSAHAPTTMVRAITIQVGRRRGHAEQESNQG